MLIVVGALLGLPDAGAVTGLGHGIDQHVRVNLAEQLQVCPFAGQVDADAFDPGHLEQRALDAAGARGAGHAADAQFQALGGDAVAGLLNGLYQCRQAVVRSLDARLFGRQVDADSGGALDFSQRPLDAPGATGAGHAGNRQIEGGGIGHRSYSL